VAVFSRGKIVYPALATFAEGEIRNLSIQDGTGIYSCVVFGKWDDSDTKFSCPKIKAAFGSDIFSESNAQALRNGTFDLSKYSDNFNRFMSDNTNPN
jgi:hypothetical protein